MKRNNLMAFVVALIALLTACHSQALVLEGNNGSVETFEKGAVLFSNRAYKALQLPEPLQGAKFIRTAIEAGQQWYCVEPGVVYAIVAEAHPAIRLTAELRQRGFQQLPVAPFQLFGSAADDRAIVLYKSLAKGELLPTRKWVVLLAQGELRLTKPKFDQPWSDNKGELLYNNIRLPEIWPPRHLDVNSDEPMPSPPLEAPPAVINIDVGRQLFIDDFLVEESALEREFHLARKYEGNPVFKPETPYELKPNAVCYLGHGGVFYDPQDSFVKMWYSVGDLDGALAMARSRDCFNWERPDFGLSAGGNLLLPRGGRTRGDHAGGDNSIWLDTLTANKAERIKFLTQRDSKDPHWLAVSADGLSWSDPVPAGRAADYCSFFYNPFRSVWVYSVKRGGSRGRCRYYAESPIFLKEHGFDSSVYWCNADRLDEPDPVAQCAPQLYSLNAVAYESVMLGIFYVHLGPPNNICAEGKYPKITELKLGYSRDGFYWHRPDRRAFIPATRVEGSWDRAYLHSTTGVCLIDGDRLLFPYCAYSGIAPDGSRGIYHGASIGLAILRRDGFASLNAGEHRATLTTRPLQFSGRYLFVNADCPQGELRAEILDVDNRVIQPFTLENSQMLSTDKTLVPLRWQGADDLSAVAGSPVRIRFHLKNGRLYSFWVSQHKTGESGGYLAAGSLGQTGIIDTK